MNSLFDSNPGEAPLASSLPLSLLALVELALLKRDYAQFVNAPAEDDRWFVMGGDDTTGPMRFHEVLRRLAKGEGPLAVLREADADQDPAPWQTIEYQACASNRATALAVIIGFWVVAVFFGWMAIAVLVPQAQVLFLERAYFVAAIALVAWLSLPGGMRAKLRGKQY
jgi:hypothetical protein